MPVTVQQVKKVHESNNRFRTAAEFAAARDALQVERLELEPRRSKAERAVAREERRRELQSSLRTTDRRRVMRLEQPRKKRTPGRNHPYAMRGRTSRKNHKPLTLAA